MAKTKATEETPILDQVTAIPTATTTALRSITPAQQGDTMTIKTMAVDNNYILFTADLDNGQRQRSQIYMYPKKFTIFSVKGTEITDPKTGKVSIENLFTFSNSAGTGTIMIAESQIPNIKDSKGAAFTLITFTAFGTTNTAT